MKYWIISPNLGAQGEKKIDAWVALVQKKKIAVMGYDESDKYGKMFIDKVSIGDMILVASGSNAYKRLYLVGVVAGGPETELGEDPPTYFSYFRKLEPAILLDKKPSNYGISFDGAAYGDAQQIPAIYQLYPESNQTDQKIVKKMLELLQLSDPALTDTRYNDELIELVNEFKKEYIDTGDVEYHRNLLLRARKSGKENFEKVLQLQQQGSDITNAVLYGLLPHHDTKNNRELGHWIHVAPSITRDVKEWFEGAGWAKSEDWPDTAKQLFTFIQNAVKYPNNFKDFCREFDESFPYRGFQVGMLSPILNVLAPEHYLIVNKKPVMVINWLTNSKFKAQIKDMPEIIPTIKQWVDENFGIFEPLTSEGINLYDIFDIFCHWLYTVKKYPLKSTLTNSRFVDFTRNSSESAKNTFYKIFRDENNRTEAEKFLTECIFKAHEGNTNNWEITLGPHYIMFNVGFVRILRFHIKEINIYLLGSSFNSELREKYADIINFSEKHFKSFEEEIGECVIAPTKFSDIINDLKYAVFEFIKANSIRSKASIWAGSHSPGVTKYLLQATGLNLPSPDYDEDIEITIEDEYEIDTDENVLYVEEETKEINADHSDKEKVNYWWLNANPNIWDMNVQPIGSMQIYTSHNSKGNKRRIYQYFGLIKPGDLLLGYVASPIRQITSLLEVTRALHTTENGEVFEFKKIEQFARPISLNELRNVAELEKCEPFINNQGSLFRLQPEEYEVIRSIIDEVNEGIGTGKKENPVYTLTECAEETGFAIERLEQWMHSINRKKQAVLYGPPGTGKTFIAEHLARHIIGGGDGFYELLQFHPSYSYEEFMQGIRPVTDEKGSLTFDLNPGRFLSFCTRAAQCNGKCALVIDEINRANLSKVFGELMYLLEYRNKDIPLAGGVKFAIPENVWIIGTMNTADRSIALVDFALRRRFAFMELAPEYELLSAFQKKRGFNTEGLIVTLRDINAKINDKNFFLGISFFMMDDLMSSIESIWKMEIETYLEEYFFSQPEIVNNFRWEKVKYRIHS